MDRSGATSLKAKTRQRPLLAHVVSLAVWPVLASAVVQPHLHPPVSVEFGDKRTTMVLQKSENTFLRCNKDLRFFSMGAPSHQNKGGNSVFFDLLLFEAVVAKPGIQGKEYPAVFSHHGEPLLIGCPFGEVIPMGFQPNPRLPQNRREDLVAQVLV